MQCKTIQFSSVTRSYFLISVHIVALGIGRARGLRAIIFKCIISRDKFRFYGRCYRFNTFNKKNSYNKGGGTGKFRKKQNEKNKKCDWPLAIAKFLVP
jgi:hypothetical protein